MDRTNNIISSPLCNAYVDDYESGMEASASSMAEEEDVEIPDEMSEDGSHGNCKCKSRRIHSNRRRMSSDNSSTDSSHPTTTPKSSKLNINIHHPHHANHITSPLQSIIPRSYLRHDDMPTPSSGYDGDTEGPIKDDTK